jgi:GH25 family lysozyme M1 (1,4-beta-N-acetylmuramidase)
MTVRARWLAKYNVARLWASIARRRYMWKPSAKNKAELERRRRQVDYALRVLKRHPPHQRPEPAKGLDVSNLQGRIDWAQVQQAGYRFVWIKAGEGDWKDPNFLHNVKAAKAAGLKVGAYHFLRPKPGRTGAKEALYFIDRLEAAGLAEGDLLPVADVEATTLDRSATHAYVRQPTLPKPWKHYVAWQYTSKGSVPGIRGDVDLNRTDDLRKLVA